MADITLIRKNGYDAVTAYDDAAVFHQAIGDAWEGDSRGVVYKGVYKEFALIKNDSAKKISVQAGYGQLYGREFKLDSGKTYDVTVAGALYVLVYVQIDITSSSETGALKTISSSTNNISIGNTDIYKNKIGTATMPLFLAYYDGSAWYILNDYRHIREPGQAESARSMPNSGILNGTKVEDLVEYGSGYVRKARYSDVAGNALKIGPSGNNNDVDSNLAFPNHSGVAMALAGRYLASLPSLAKGVNQPIGWTEPTGGLVCFMIRVTAKNGTTSYYSNGAVSTERDIYLYTIDNKWGFPLEGMGYTQGDNSWAKLTLKKSGATITALIDGITDVNVTVSIVTMGV